MLKFLIVLGKSCSFAAFYILMPIENLNTVKAFNVVLMCATLAAVLMATGCDDGFADEPIGGVENALTVEEAEAYFE